jgi:hypothetical protein
MGLLATTLFSRSRDDQDLVGAYAWSKPISFWQAWGLMLLSQILFKANMQRNVPVGPMLPQSVRACRRPDDRTRGTRTGNLSARRPGQARWSVLGCQAVTIPRPLAGSPPSSGLLSTRSGML